MMKLIMVIFSWYMLDNAVSLYSSLDLILADYLKNKVKELNCGDNILNVVM